MDRQANQLLKAVGPRIWDGGLTSGHKWIWTRGDLRLRSIDCIRTLQNNQEYLSNWPGILILE